MMELSKSTIYHTESSKSPYDPIPCAADVQTNGDVHFNFAMERKGPEYLRLDLDVTDLRDILLYLAKIVPGAPTLFAECVANAIAADEARFADVASFVGQGPNMTRWIVNAVNRQSELIQASPKV